ncbi:MAG: hypothetical protein QXO33_06845 [Nitrososphaeria archaeon]
MGLFRKKEEKKLEEIVEKVTIASETFVKTLNVLTQASQNLANSVQDLQKNFEEIRKGIEGIKSSLDEFSQKVNKIEPVGLGEVENLLVDILGELGSIREDLRWSSGTFSQPLESMLADIRDEIRNLSYEIGNLRFSSY